MTVSLLAKPITRRGVFSVKGLHHEPPKPDALHDLEVGHHHHVLVFQVVAVEDVAAPVAVETNKHARLLARGQVHGVFPTGVRGQGSSAVTGEHLEVDQVQVYGVRSRGRPEVPGLGRPQLWSGRHAPRIERFAVDTPHHPAVVSDPRKAELACAPGAGCGKVVKLFHVRKPLWYGAFVFLLTGNTE